MYQVEVTRIVPWWCKGVLVVSLTLHTLLRIKIKNTSFHFIIYEYLCLFLVFIELHTNLYKNHCPSFLCLYFLSITKERLKHSNKNVCVCVYSSCEIRIFFKYHYPKMGILSSNNTAVFCDWARIQGYTYEVLTNTYRMCIVCALSRLDIGHHLSSTQKT